MLGKRWSSAEEGRLRELVAKKVMTHHISQILEREFGTTRTYGAIHAKKHYNRTTIYNHLDVPDTRPNADVLAERDRRRLLEPQSLTALLCGDPLPGTSALDRIRK